MAKLIRSLIIIAALLFPFSTWASVIYQHDDGSGESSVGCGSCSIIWLNAFQAVAGGTSITSIDIAFGSNTSGDPPPNGSPIDVFLWDDPNDDGDPTDAVIVSTVAGTVQSSHTDTFINFVLSSPVSLSVGDFFFAGFRSTDFAVSRDTNSSAGQSWLSAWSPGPADPNNLSAATVGGGYGLIDDIGFPGNFLIRANGNGNVDSVPEPTTLLLMGVGLVGLGFARRRRLNA